YFCFCPIAQQPSRPSSIDVPSTSSAVIDPLLMQPGPSSRYLLAPTSSANQLSTSHPLSSRTAPSANHAETERQDGQRVTVHNAPRLIIPPNNMFSPQNQLMTPLGPFLEEGEGIVPSTPVLYA